MKCWTWHAATLATALVAGSATAQEPTPEEADTPAATIVVADTNHPWAAAQIGGALSGTVEYHEGSLLQALSIAKSGSATGVVEIKLDTAAAFESGRVVCYAVTGKKIWEEKVMFNLGGGQERIARRFTDALEKKVRGRRCAELR